MITCIVLVYSQSVWNYLSNDLTFSNMFSYYVFSPYMNHGSLTIFIHIAINIGDLVVDCVYQFYVVTHLEYLG